MATAKYTQPHPDPFSFPQTSAESYQVGPWNAGVSVIMPMPLPSEWHDQWARGQARVDALPTSTPPQPPPRRPSDGLALNTVTTAATPAAVMAKEEPHAEGLTAKSARTSPVPRATPSPEGEDTYTDSWLAGMLWASSSSPDVEGLEVGHVMLSITLRGIPCHAQTRPCSQAYTVVRMHRHCRGVVTFPRVQ